MIEAAADKSTLRSAKGSSRKGKGRPPKGSLQAVPAAWGSTWDAGKHPAYCRADARRAVVTGMEKPAGS